MDTKKILMKQIYLAGSLAIFAITACTKHNENNNVNAADQSFMNQIAVHNKAEIAAAQLALSKTNDASVKAFGQMMVASYSKADVELQKIAAEVHFQLDDAAVSQRQVLPGLDALSGFSFDTAYMNNEVKTHKNILSIYQMAFNEGNNASVKGYVHRNIDVVEMNYLKADSVARAL
jgi:putative membrane protein